LKAELKVGTIVRIVFFTACQSQQQHCYCEWILFHVQNGLDEGKETPG
jgi:hypothetical protein